jgi:hypothetical protein
MWMSYRIYMCWRQCRCLMRFTCAEDNVDIPQALHMRNIQNAVCPHALHNLSLHSFSVDCRKNNPKITLWRLCWFKGDTCVEYTFTILADLVSCTYWNHPLHLWRSRLFLTNNPTTQRQDHMLHWRKLWPDWESKFHHCRHKIWAPICKRTSRCLHKTLGFLGFFIGSLWGETDETKAQ